MTGPPDFLIIGHITKDLTDDGYRLGGTATYSALAASRLGQRVAVVTSAGPDLDLGITLAGIEVRRQPSPATTTFRNVYEGEGREQFVSTVAHPLTARDVPREWREARIVHLAPVAQEVEMGVAALFPRSLVGATAQGWLRGWDETGCVRYRPWPWTGTGQAGARLDVLILSREDVDFREEVIARLAEEPRVLVVTEGDGGASVHQGGRWYHVPGFPVAERHPTGAGDVFAAAFLVSYARSRDPVTSALFGNCAASFLVEGGLDCLPSPAQVQERLLALRQDPILR